tara:strand:- start:334 stop:708 length:375 start_codon:yes stop_codon:yes gene_type:complete
MSPLIFGIRHFAGAVTYDCTGFMDKNKDKLMSSLEDLFSEKTNSAFKTIFNNISIPQKVSGEGEETQEQEKASSLVSVYNRQLQSLMATLNSSDPHFVRCLKPNEEKLPDVVDDGLLLKQLRYR